MDFFRGLRVAFWLEALLVVLILLALHVGRAWAEGAMPMVVAPPAVPARFDHEYRGFWSITRLPAKEAYAACGKYASFACSHWNPDRSACRTVLPQVGEHVLFEGRRTLVTVAFAGAVLRHERAHCNGWGPKHER